MAINVGSAVAYLELDTSKFSGGFKSALTDLKTFADNTSSVNTKMKALSSSFSSVGSTLTKSVTTPLVGIATAGVKTASNFQSAMSQVAATMGTTSDKIQDLNKFAQKMGAITAFSATEAAEGLNILAQSGLNAQEQMATLPNVLNLAAAGQISMGDAASYTVGAIKGFGDSVENSQKYVDLIAKGATLANTNVRGLGEALSGVSSTAKVYGQTAESTTKSLLRLAEQNVTGSEAATALSRAMMDIYTPTSSAKKALDALGVSAYDSSGNARDFNTVVDELNGALSTMTDAQKSAYENTIFTTYGMNTYNKMVSTTSEKLDQFDKGLAKASDEMNGQGSAAQQAKEQLNNLKGSLTLLKSAVEGLLIAVGDRFVPFLTNLADKVSELVTKFNDLSDEQKDQVIKFGLIAAAIGPVLLILSKVVLAVNNVFTAFSSIKTLGAAFTGLSAPIIAITAIIAALAGAFVYLWKTSEDFRDKVTSIFDDVKNKFDTFQKAVVEKLNSLGFDFEDIGDVIKAAWDTIANVIMSPIITNALELLSNSIGDALNIILDIVSAITAAFSGDWSGVKESLGNLASDIYKLFQELPSQILSLVGDLGANILKALGLDEAAAAFQSFFDTIASGFGSVGDFLTNLGNNLATFFTEIIPSAFGSVVDFFVNIGTSIGSFFTETIPNAISTFVNETIPALLASIAAFPGWLAAQLGYALGSIVGFITTIPERATEGLSMLWTMLTEWFNNVTTSLMTFITSIPSRVNEFFTNLVTNVSAWFSNLVNTAGTAGQSFVSAFINWLTSLPGAISQKFNEIVQAVLQWGSDLRNNVRTEFNNIIDDIKSINLYDAGKKIIKSLWNGLKDMWSSVKGWFGGLWKNFKSGFTAGFGDSSSVRATALSIDGSHRNGLSYVPWDGYRAELHKGERVLTKEQAEEYNKGNGNSGGDTFVFYNTKPDPYEYSRQMKRSKRELAYNL
jgi:TP901 family phage tail tape measure protein